ncbi:MAG: hypothetical protein AVDCRST_MAG54-670, partial [uncultured Actinomycetospora sp.]
CCVRSRPGGTASSCGSPSSTSPCRSSSSWPSSGRCAGARRPSSTPSSSGRWPTASRPPSAARSGGPARPPRP